MSEQRRRIPIGSKWERWTVIRCASPAPRYNEPGTRARVHVRCVCGHEQIVFVNDLRSGKTGGCKRSKCAAKWEASRDMLEHLHGAIERFFAEG